MAAQAIDIVHELKANDQNDVGIYHEGTSPLEMVSFGPQDHCDDLLPGLSGNERILAYRYKDLVILKNLTGRNLIVQGRVLRHGDFCRIFAGQRILIDDQVLSTRIWSFISTPGRTSRSRRSLSPSMKMTKCGWKRTGRAIHAWR